MKIEFDNNEYRRLLELIHIATWVIDSHVPGGKHPKAEEHYKVQQKIYSMAESQGLGKFINFDMKDGYHETHDFEGDEHMQYVHDYDEHSFWANLIQKLAARDLCDEMGNEEEFFGLEFPERLKRMAPFAEAYDAEFNENGLSNVDVKK